MTEIDAKKYPPLNLPVFDAKVRIIDERIQIWDAFRMKFVVLTPEEWVRQHFAQFLTSSLGYPKSLLKIEYGLNYHGVTRRPDIGVVQPEGGISMLVECKSPRVILSEDVFLQCASYYSITRSEYIVLTNGIEHIYARIEPMDGKIVYTQEIPSYR